LSPLSGEERKSNFGAVRSVNDPGCVKTCTSRECTELFSLFSSFDGDFQSGSFVIQRNRDKRSTRKFDVGVFTQPGPATDIDSSPLISGMLISDRIRISDATASAVGRMAASPIPPDSGETRERSTC